MAFAAFATGFLNKTTENIDRRKAEGNDYFQQQMDRARTVGMDALRKRRTTLDGTISVARNLQREAQMPEHIIRGLANEGPEVLEQAYEIYSKSTAAGVTVDENFWENVYSFSKEIQSDGQPLNKFLEQVIGLYGNNLEASKETGGDPFGAFVASGLGYNAMDRAREKLDSTEIAEGFTAGDLLAMEGRPLTTRPLGDTGSTVNQGYLVDAAKGAKGEGSLTETEVMSFTNTFNSRTDEIAERLYSQHVNTNGAGDATQNDFREEARRQAAIEIYETFENQPSVLPQLSMVFKHLPPEIQEQFFETATPEQVQEVTQRDEITTTTLPPADTGMTGRRFRGDNGVVYTLQGATEDGKITLVGDDGSEQSFTPEEFAAFQAGDLAPQTPAPSRGPSPRTFGGGGTPLPTDESQRTVQLAGKTWTFVRTEDGMWVYANEDGEEKSIPPQTP